MSDLQEIIKGIKSINSNGGVFYIYGYQNRITFDLVRDAITKLNIKNVVHLKPSPIHRTQMTSWPYTTRCIIDAIYKTDDSNQDCPIYFSPDQEVTDASIIIVTDASFVEDYVAISLLRMMKPLIIMDDPTFRINEMDRFSVYGWQEHPSGYGYLTRSTPNFYQLKKTSRIADFVVQAVRYVTGKSGAAA